MSDETNITVSDESGVVPMETLLSETGNGDLDLSSTNGTPYDPELDDPIIGLEYLATFADLKDYEDTLEERTSSVCSGVHYSTKRERETWIAKGYQPITVEEQNALVDGGVRRKSDGAIVPRPPVIIPLQSRIDSLLSQINNYTAEQITSGFVSEVTSGQNPGVAKFDSTTNDQNTFSMMYAASQSPDFETTQPYLGYIPVRGYRAIDGGFEPEKEVFYLNAENMQRLMDNLALHIGQCKIVGWGLQAKASAATEETIDSVEAEIWAIIGYDPNPEPEPNA